VRHARRLWRRLLKHQITGAPDAQLVSIAPSCHCVMCDQPGNLDRAVEELLEKLP